MPLGLVRSPPKKPRWRFTTARAARAPFLRVASLLHHRHSVLQRWMFPSRDSQTVANCAIRMKRVYRSINRPSIRLSIQFRRIRVRQSFAQRRAGRLPRSPNHYPSAAYWATKLLVTTMSLVAGALRLVNAPTIVSPEIDGGKACNFAQSIGAPVTVNGPML